MSLPTRAEKFAELIEYLRKGQEAAAWIAHLHTESDRMDNLLRKGWLGVSELLKRLVYQVTELAKKGFH